MKVTVVTILASDQHEKVDAKLKDIATAVTKREPTLTGFRLERSTCKKIQTGEKLTFPLPEDNSVNVTLNAPKEKETRPSLTVKPPSVGEISYSCCTGKYFPIVTRYVTKERERLIIAVMIKPYEEEKDKDKKKPDTEKK
jgi:hypothetical protein